MAEAALHRPALAAAGARGRCSTYPLAALPPAKLSAPTCWWRAWFHVNINELFAAQGIVNAKGFLRLHLSADGTLTIYPLTVDRVGRKWTPTPTATADQLWLEPPEPLRARLAEPPIRCR